MKLRHGIFLQANIILILVWHGILRLGCMVRIWAEDYEYTERLGFGGSYNLSDTLVLSASTFFLDTTSLSRSIFEDRGKVEEEDGGVSNTEDFSSFVVSLDGDFNGLQYHLAYIKQAAGIGDEEDEKGYVATVLYSYEGQFTYSPIIEYVYLDNAEGIRSRQIDYLTIGVGIDWSESLSSSVSHTIRDIDSSGEDSIDDDHTQIGIGYAFNKGISLELGWKRTQESNETSNSLGLLMVYEFSF